MPSRPRSSGLSNNSVTLFSETVLFKSPTPLALADYAHIHRSDLLDENRNVFFASFDGTLGGVIDFLRCSVSSECQYSHAHWSVAMSGEHFVSSPVDVSVAGSEQGLLLAVSSRGTLLVFDQYGNIVSQVRIPNVIVELDKSVNLNVSLVADADKLADRVQWDIDEFDLSAHDELHRLAPVVYTSPLVLSGSCAASHPKSSIDCVVIPVNFVSADLILASLLVVNSQALLSTHPREWRHTSLLVPLELDRLDPETLPPYLFSRPVPVSSYSTTPDWPVSSDHLIGWHPMFSILITQYNGKIHRIRLPLKHATAFHHVLWSVGAHSNVGYSHACLMVDCPHVNPVRGNPRLCCLLLDDSSNLHLIITDVEPDHHIPSADRILWTYRPQSNARFIGRQQLGQVSLVLSACTLSYCDLWAVYPSPDGFVHAVSVSTGSSLPGYPVQLFESINAMSGRSFTAGSGIVYTPDGHTPWMLFSDTFGCFYHLQLTEPPVVLTNNHTAESSNAAVMWLSPMPIVVKSSRSPNRLALLVTNTSGLTLLFPDYSSEHQLFEFPLFDAAFLDEHHQPTEVIHLNVEHRYITYRIRNCPITVNSALPPRTTYAARLVDAFGHALSTWSIPDTASTTAPNLSHSSCVGTLTFTQPVYTAFRQSAYLQVVNTWTGRLLPHSLMHPDVACSVLLDAHTAWPCWLIVWTYLPLCYFFTALMFLRWQAANVQSASSGCSV